MSLNIAPQIPQVIVNSAAPATESLARANAVREVVPAPTQVEAAVPQKSREQDARPPSNQQAVTYEGILQGSDNRIIQDGEQQNPEQGSQQNSGEQNDSEQDLNGQENSEVNSAASDEQTAENEQEAQQKRAEDRVERAEQRVELAEIRQLEQRDAEVRAHEQAHAAVGGQYAGTPSYDYETGPNGKKYAVGGEVPIDVSVAGTPQETIRKMQTVRAAALAPAEPSSQDRKVAAEATRKLADARADLIAETNETQQSRSRGADDDDDSEFEVNQDSPLSQEPRKRILSGQGEEQEQSSNIDASANRRLEDNEEQESELATPAATAQNSAEELEHSDEQFFEQTAAVIASRYANSYQQVVNSGFSATA